MDEPNRQLVITLMTKLINVTSLSSLKNVFYRKRFLIFEGMEKEKGKDLEKMLRKEATGEDLEKKRVLLLI